MKIDDEAFTDALSILPLISIDLIVKNYQGDILLGLRNNSPAKGEWFVPGGRIKRMEKIKQAFERLTESELGFKIDINKTSLIGIFEHMYPNSAYSENIGVHYISIGVLIENKSLNINNLPICQHNEYKWFTLEEIQTLDTVHPRTKEFFKTEIGLRR